MAVPKTLEYYDETNCSWQTLIETDLYFMCNFVKI